MRMGALESARATLYDPCVSSAKRPEDLVPPKPALTPYQRAFLGAMLLLLLASIVLRVLPRAEPAAPPGGITPYANAVVEGSAATEGEQPPGGLPRFLPYLTEGALFGLIGFALGYASRKLLKLALICAVLIFLVVQLLSWSGIVSVDWRALLNAPLRWIHALSENEALGAAWTGHVPAAIVLIVGGLFGFRRG